jgi:predicted enzyme related to lactoylglutathione lyase
MVTLVPIRKMDRAIKFFSSKLGGKVKDRARGPMKNFWASMKIGGVEVWLIAPSKREKRSLAYTTLLVRDIKRYVGGLQRKGVKFEKAERMGPETKIDGVVATDQFGAAAFFKDSEANLWMVWQNFPPM